MRKPFSRVVTLLTYMDGSLVDTWKEEQMHKLQEAIDDGVVSGTCAPQSQLQTRNFSIT